MSKHEAGPGDQTGRSQQLKALIAQNDLEGLQETLKEDITVTPSMFIDLARRKMQLEDEANRAETKARKHRLKIVASAVSGLVLGAASSFGYAIEATSDQADAALSNRAAVTEVIPNEAAIFIPGPVKRDLDSNPAHKDLPIVPTAAWCEPNGTPGQPGTLHYDVVIGPGIGFGVHDPVSNSGDFCDPNNAITIPNSGFAASFDLVPYHPGK